MLRHTKPKKRLTRFRSVTEQVGLVGLGNAGRPIAQRLLKAGYSVKVFDLEKSKSEFLARLGACVASSAREAAGKITLIALPSSREVVKAVLGKNGVLEGLKKRDILVDLSGTAPQTAKKIEAEAKKRGVRFLGATLHASGAPAVTLAQGSAALVVGGDRRVAGEVLEIFKTFAAKIILVRDVAIPKALKIAIIMMAVPGHLAAAEAAFWLAAQAVDPRLLYRVMSETGSLTGVRYLKRILQGGIGQGGMMRNTKKDLTLARSVAKKIGFSLPFMQRASQILRQASAMGLEKEDLPKALRIFYQSRLGVNLKTSLPVEVIEGAPRKRPAVIRL
ncbi:MAG: NAD(P)-dependent oxidoreductase [Deltaproteobacteria bacterium]|nr:NAD(P)-dependent oxidoreductase [Deltaproteobacteria bacterium]